MKMGSEKGEIETQNIKNHWGKTREEEEEYYKSQNIKSQNSIFKKTTNNISLFTKSWIPISKNTRGIILLVHGYGNDISWTFQNTPIFFAQNGFACFALDLQGHGNSQGLKGFIPDLDSVVDDLVSFFASVLTKNPEFGDLPKFLFGESMGAAICLLIHLKNKNPESILFKGAILVAPMCRISEKVRPKWPIPEILTFVAKFAPTLPIVPTADLLDKSVKVPEKKVIGGMNPRRYLGKPRLGTVVELLRATDYLGKNLGEIEIPFIVLHGDADVVTDPEVSRELYEVAKSGDKTIKIYDGMYHSLLFGETDENVEVVRGDILSWLNDRC